MSRSTSGRRDHLVPASLIGGFSLETGRRLRERIVWVRRRNVEPPFRLRAEKVAWRQGFYPESAALWAGQEPRLPETVDFVARHRGSELLADPFLLTLVPFIASLFVRGPDFDRRMDARLTRILGQNYAQHLRPNNTDTTRAIEWQRLLAVVLNAEWTIFRNPTTSPLLINDRGWAPIRDMTHPARWGYLFPLTPSVVLGLRYTGQRPDFDFSAGRVIGIADRWIDQQTLRAFNGALSTWAEHEIYGPTDSSVLSAGGWTVPTPEALRHFGIDGLVPPGFDLIDHDMTWLWLIGRRRAATNRLPNLRGGFVALPLNLLPSKPGKEAMAQLALEQVEVAIEQGNIPHALEEVERAIDLDRAGVEEWVHSRIALANFGRAGRDSVEGSVNRCERILRTEREPSARVAAAVELALIRLGQSNILDARKLLRQASRFSPFPDVTLRQSAVLLETCDDPTGAESLYVRSGTFATTDGCQALLHLGIMRWHTGRVRGAVWAFNRVVERDDREQSPHAAYLWAQMQRAEGRSKKAEDLYELAIAMDSDRVTPSAAGQLGLLYLARGRIQEALSLLRFVAQTHDVDATPRAAFNLAQALWQHGLGTPAERIPLYRRASRSHIPDLVPVAALMLGTLQQDEGANEDAKRSLGQALTAGDEAVTRQAAYRLAWLAEAEGEAGTAIAMFETASLSDDLDVSSFSLLRLGLLHRAANRDQEALAAFQRCEAKHHPIASEAARHEHQQVPSQLQPP